MHPVQHVVVDDVLESLVKDATKPSHTEHHPTAWDAVMPSEEPAKPMKLDPDVVIEAADKRWRLSKSAYFHPDATPSAYLREILTDPYFKCSNHV
jgi:hypothetical protein